MNNTPSNSPDIAATTAQAPDSVSSGSALAPGFEFSGESVKAMRKLTAFKLARLGIWAFVLFGLAPQLILLVPSQWSEFHPVPRIFLTLLELAFNLEQWVSAHWGVFLLFVLGANLVLVVANLNQILSCCHLVTEERLSSVEKFQIAQVGDALLLRAYRLAIIGSGVGLALVTFSALYKGFIDFEYTMALGPSLSFIIGLGAIGIFHSTPCLNFLVPKEIREAFQAPQNHALLKRAFLEVKNESNFYNKDPISFDDYARLCFYILCDKVGELERWRSAESTKFVQVCPQEAP